jgi:5'-nucleotidase
MKEKQFDFEGSISILDFLKLEETKRIEEIKEKKIVYIDMDNVLVDFKSAFEHYDKTFIENTENKDEIEGIFSKMKPMKDAIASVKKLSKHYSVFILSTAPWDNPSAWTDKLLWIKKYLPEECYKRLILSHNKQLNKGHYLIDDRIQNGAIGFEGEHIHFGTEDFPNWKSVTQYLLNKTNTK